MKEEYKIVKSDLQVVSIVVATFVGLWVISHLCWH